jgi:hypothetical protein
MLSWILFYFVVEQWGLHLKLATPGLFFLAGKTAEACVHRYNERKAQHA